MFAHFFGITESYVAWLGRSRGVLSDAGDVGASSAAGKERWSSQRHPSLHPQSPPDHATALSDCVLLLNLTSSTELKRDTFVVSVLR